MVTGISAKNDIYMKRQLHSTVFDLFQALSRLKGAYSNWPLCYLSLTT